MEKISQYTTLFPKVPIFGRPELMSAAQIESLLYPWQNRWIMEPGGPLGTVYGQDNGSVILWNPHRGPQPCELAIPRAKDVGYCGVFLLFSVS